MPTSEKKYLRLFFIALHKNGFTFALAGTETSKTGAYLTGKHLVDFVAAGNFVIQNGAQA